MRVAVVAGLLLVAAVGARAQTIETPVPFDSAHRVLVVTPILVERLHLAEPLWPVRGEYRDARLYSLSQGGFVLVTLLSSGALQRYELTEAQRTALSAAIDAAMATSGRPTGQVGVEASEPAGNGYARHITLLSAAVYAPLAASLFENDGTAAGAAYLLTAGGAFFISYDAAQSGQITHAQGDLSANLGLASGAVGWAAGYAATGNNDQGVRAVALGSAISGTIAGIGLGRGLTDAEAHAATVGIEGAAASAWAVAAAAGVQGRGMAAIVAASTPVGYLIGVRYPRVASYAVTAGDLNGMQTAGLVGALVGGALLTGNNGNTSPRITGIGIGASYVAGMLVGDLAIARPYDLTTSEANVVTIGAFAGGIMALSIPLVAQSDSRPLIFFSAAGGATLGMTLALGISNPRHAGESRFETSGHGPPLSIGPAATGLLGLVARRPGNYPLVRIRF
jgi:hypothetical protein